ncbi:MAG: hypothetical protein AAF297_00775 [Planctomycetota bacterium]
MKTKATLIGLASIFAAMSAASGQVVVGSGGGFSIDPDDTERFNIDITTLTGSYTSFVFTADFGGDRPSDTEFDLDVRTLFRNSTNLPFSLFLEDSNFDFVYDANNILTVTENFSENINFNADALNGGDYQTLRLDLFNDDNSRLDIDSWSLTLVPAPSAGAALAVCGLIAVRRRRA